MSESNEGASGRLFHYFSISGLKTDAGLQTFQAKSTSSTLPDELAFLPPLKRSYKSYMLGFYPEFVPSIPFDQDAVQMLCLPQGLRLKTQKYSLKPHFHSFVITREDGSQYYGFTFTFYEEVTSKQICAALYTLQSNYFTNISGKNRRENSAPLASGVTHSLPRQIRLCSTEAKDPGNFYDITKDKLYVGKCITLIGPQPYLIAASEFLKNLYTVFIHCDMDNITLEGYVYNLLYEVPAPPKGKCLAFTCIKNEQICYRPAVDELPIFEYSLQEFFSLLGIDTVIELLTCVLLENQVIILSKDYERLMLVAESICALIYPFNWQNVYVPILPSSLLHFVDAPVPFIMGVKSSDCVALPNEANLCLVDVDRGTIEVPEDLPQLPYKNEIFSELMDCFEKFSLSYNKFNNNSIKSYSEANTLISSSHLSISNTSLNSEKNFRYFQSSKHSSLPKSKKNFGSLNDVFANSIINSKIPKGPEFRLLENLPTRSDPDYLRKTLIFNNAVREIFLNLFLQIFCSYENFVNIPIVPDDELENCLSSCESLNTFDKSTFLVDQPDDSLPFLSRFIESQLFTSFIDQKILTRGQNFSADNAFDKRIRAMRDNYDNTITRTATYSYCTTIEITEAILTKRLFNIDYKAPAPCPLDPNSDSCTHFFNPGLFPLLDKVILNKEPPRSKRRSARAWHRRERQAQHLEQNDKKELLLLSENRSSHPSHAHPKLADMSLAQMAATNWTFVEQLLKECKTRTKRMLVQKLGYEAIELGHVESNFFGVEENTLIASLCDLLERIWGHGLQRKQGKSALWSHLISYEEMLVDGTIQRNDINASSHMSPDLSSKAQEFETTLNPLHKPHPARSRSADRSLDRRDMKPDLVSVQPLTISVAFDMKTVLTMSEVKSHIGYARAWVRLALEKKLLSRHLTELLSNTELLRALYKRYAFLRCDEEKEQFLNHLLSLNAVDFFCFTNKYCSSVFPYKILIFTSRRPTASTTTANLWVSIGGSLAHTGVVRLPKNQLEMTLQHVNLGLLTTLRIGHDNTGISPKLIVEHVLVRNEATGHAWKFPCGRWLGRGVDDGSLERILVGELVPVGLKSETLVEACRTPPTLRSPNASGFAGYRKVDLKNTAASIQQILGDAVNNLVKYFYKPEPDRGSLTLLLCGDLGLVRSMEMVFTFGFKSSRFFGKNLYLWDYFDKVQNQFEQNLKEEIERQNLSGLIRNDETQSFAAMSKFIRLANKINLSSAYLGKDDKFQLFVCVAVRDHLLHRILLPLHKCPVTTQMYEESSFLRDPLLVRDLINVLSALSDFEFVLETTLIRGVES